MLSACNDGRKDSSPSTADASTDDVAADAPPSDIATVWRDAGSSADLDARPSEPDADAVSKRDAGERTSEPLDAGGDDVDSSILPWMDAGTGQPMLDANATSEATPVEGGSAQPDARGDDAGSEPCQAPSEQSSAQLLLTELHADVLSFALDCDGSRLLISSKADSPVGNGLTSEHTPESVLIYGGPDFLVTLPDERFEDLGEVGSELFLFPEYQLQQLIWPGWQSYDVPTGVLRNDELEVVLEHVEGPGKFAAFYSPQDELSPPTYVFNPAQNILGAAMSAGGHVHMNWAFTEPGLYLLSFSVRGILTDGTAVSSATHTLRFFVGDLAELPVTQPTVLRVEGTLSTSAPGEPAQLLAARYGAPSELPVRWFRSRIVFIEGGDPTLSPWELVSHGDSLELASNAEGFQYRASLFDADIEVATSAPVQPSFVQ